MPESIRGIAKKRNLPMSIGPIVSDHAHAKTYRSSPGSVLVCTILTGLPLNHCQKKTP